MRLLLVLALVACGDNRRMAEPVDAGVDAPDAYTDPNFFGEPCNFVRNPDYPEALAICHCDSIDDGTCIGPRGNCVEEPAGSGVGVCRAPCDQLHPDWNPEHVCIGAHAGGTPTWTPGRDGTSGSDSPGSWCYCMPPA